MNKQDLYYYLYDNFCKIFKKGYYNTSLYLNRISDACKLFAYINPKAVEYALYQIMEQEKNGEYYDSAIIKAVQELLFYEINIPQTLSFINSVKKEYGQVNPELVETCQFYLDIYEKGNTYKSNFSQSLLFTKEHVRDYKTFVYYLGANIEYTTRMPSIFGKLYIISNFYIHLESKYKFKEYCEKLKKQEQQVLLKEFRVDNDIEKTFMHILNAQDDEEFIDLCNHLSLKLKDIHFEESLNKRVTNLLKEMQED